MTEELLERALEEYDCAMDAGCGLTRSDRREAMRAVLVFVETKIRDEVRHKALAIAQEGGDRDRRRCGHDDLHLFGVTDPCLSCAVELGRLEGGCEAGLYYTQEEVFGELLQKYRDKEPQ